jgi:hypothetical protein
MMKMKIIIADETSLEEALNASLDEAEQEAIRAARLSKLLAGVDIFGGSTLEKEPDEQLLVACAVGDEPIRGWVR